MVKEKWMYLLIIILNKEEYLDDLIACLTELGIEQGAIIDTQSMSSVLAEQIPIFASLRISSSRSKVYSKTILAVTENKKVGKEIIGILKTLNIDFEKEGRIIVLKTESVVGSMYTIDLE
jgi:hypothetical protein